MKRLLAVVSVLVIGLLAWSALGVNPASALGTPQIVSISPPSGSPVGSNVCIRAKIDWDSEFRAMRIRFGNEGWQESAEIEFERCFGTGHLSSGWYTIRVEAARQGDNSWSNPTVAEAGYELTASAPQATATSIPYGPAIAEVSFNPSGGTQAGNNVGVHIRVDSSNPGAIRIYVPCGSVDHFEHTVPEYDTTWRTSGCGAGAQTVRVCARHVNDPGWAYSTCTERSYSLSAPPPQLSAPSASFWVDTGSIQQGECTWLHWTTSDATTVDIDGMVVSASGDMQVCPTVTKHYSLKAVGAGGTATRSLSITVSAVPPPTAVLTQVPPPTAVAAQVLPTTTSPQPRVDDKPPEVSAPSASLRALRQAEPIRVNVCNPGCQDENWVEFSLPANTYVEGSLRLHTSYFLAWPLSWFTRVLEAEAVGEDIIIRMGLSHRLVQFVTLNGRWGRVLSTLRDPSIWWLTYEPLR